jgi:hypothetical protein
MLTVTAPETMNTDVLDIMGEIFARFVTRELKKNRPGACPPSYSLRAERYAA